MNREKKKRIISLFLAVVMIIAGVITCQGTDAKAATIKVKYGGKKYTYKQSSQTSATVNDKTLKLKMPGILINGTNMVWVKVFKNSSLDIDYSYKSSKKVATFKKDGKTVKLTMGSKNAKVNGKTVKLTVPAQRMYHTGLKKYYIMVPARFVAENLGFSYTWKKANRTCIIKNKTVETETPTPSPVATPKPTAVPNVSGAGVTGEVKAMWISYLEYGTGAKTEEAFTTKMNTIFDNCVSYGMNTVIVQVRPFSDAMYKSAYFPSSMYASGKLGTDPGYDPLAIMVRLAHEKGLKIEAWVNPYRVTLGSTDATKLPDGHPAKTWATSDDEAVTRRVLKFGQNLYYNPSIPEVRALIVDGVKEIVQNYQVDGIHFDDYFYPSLGNSYKTNFDSEEYDTYQENCETAGTTADDIVTWRRNNVSTLVKDVYAAVKAINPNVLFGISPAGNIDNLNSKSSYYVDIATWMAGTEYVDYIAPQVYWSFQNKTCPFAATVDRWCKLKTSPSVKLYIGVAVYRACSTEETEWKNSTDVLKRQIEYGRTKAEVSGFAFYRYDSFTSKTTQPEIANLLPVLTGTAQ